jgi:hypothetical protein
MFRKLVLVISGAVGAVIGVGSVWVFHYILDANPAFITAHRVLCGFVGVGALLCIGQIAFSLRNEKPRIYGLFVMGVGAGLFVQAIALFPTVCGDDCQTDFTLKLATSLILIVDGYSSYSGKTTASPPK